MPLKAPLPESELAICRRLKLYRERGELPRRLFARDAGLDTSVIIRIELGRAPLRYGVALKILRAFPINPRWLATGQGPLSARVLLPSPEDVGIADRELFSNVYRDKVEVSLWPAIKNAEAEPSQRYGRREHPTNPKGRAVAERFMCADIHEWFTQVSDARFNDMINAIRYAALPFLDSWKEDDEKERSEHERLIGQKSGREKLRDTPETAASKKKILTDCLRTDTTLEMRTYSRLLSDLKKASVAAGSVGKLAKLIGIPKASLAAWMARKKKPGCEATLKLLNWVERPKG